MKRILLIIAAAVLLLNSCVIDSSIENPYAAFQVNYDLVIPGESVYFSNYSTNASRYEWDFGDGTFSSLPSPSHYYLNEGLYEVRLAAYYGNRVDYAYMTIEVYETTLEVEVVEYYSGNLIPNANVVVYASEFDYNNFYQPVARGYSDSYGAVIFKGMRSEIFYIDVVNNYYNNYTLAAEDINFIKTLPLEHAKHNIFTAYVDYDPQYFKSANEKITVREVKQTSQKRTLKEKQEALKK